MREDTEAVKKFVESDTFEKLMKSLDEQDRADKEDAEQFLRDIKVKEQEDTYNYLLHGAESLVKENPEAIEALQDLQKGESE